MRSVNGRVRRPEAMATVAVLVVTALLAGCGAGPDVRASDGCGTTRVEPGDYEAVNTANGAEQVYWVVVPESYDVDEPMPLYLKLGSGGGDAGANYAAWRPLIGEPEGLFVVAGTRTSAETEPATYEALLDRLTTEYCIDLDRIHVQGSSWSSGLAARLMCAMPDTFASFADSLGSFSNLGDCDPEPKPLVSITGDSDRTAVTASVETWAAINGCDPDPDVDDLGAGITRFTYRSCEADTVLYDFAGMSHQLPATECVGPAGIYCAEYEDFDTFTTYEAFFAEHPLDAPGG